MEDPAVPGAAEESGQPGVEGGQGDDNVEKSGASAVVPRILARPPRKAKPPQGVRVLESKESMRSRLRKALAPYLTATYWQGEMAKKFTAEYIEAHPPPEDEDDLPAYIAQHLKELNRVTERWSGCVVKALDPLSHQMAVDDRLQRQRNRAEGLPVESLDLDFAMRPGLSPASAAATPSSTSAPKAAPPPPPPPAGGAGDVRLTASQIVSAVHLVSDIKVWEEILAAKKAEERRQHAIAELHLHHAARIIQRSWRSFIGRRKEEKARLDSLVSPDVQAMLSAAAYKAMRDARNKLALTRLRKSLSRRARVGGFGSSAPRDLNAVRPMPGGGGGGAAAGAGPHPPAGRRPPKPPGGPRGAAAAGGEARRHSRDASGAPSGSRSALDSAGGADQLWEGEGEEGGRGSSAGGDSAAGGSLEGLSRSTSRRTGSANSGRGVVRASSMAARSAHILKRLVSLKGQPQPQGVEGSGGRGDSARGSEVGGGGPLEEREGEGEGGEAADGWTPGVPRPAAGRYAAADDEEGEGEGGDGGGNFDDMQPEPLPEGEEEGGEEDEEDGEDGEWEEADGDEDEEGDDGGDGESALQGLLRPENADQAVAEAEAVVEMAAALAEAFMGGLGGGDQDQDQDQEEGLEDEEEEGQEAEGEGEREVEEGAAAPGTSADGVAVQEQEQEQAAGGVGGAEVPSAPKAPRPPARGEGAARAPAPRRGGRASALSMSSDMAAMRHVIAGALAAAAAPVLGRSGALAVARLGLGEPLPPPHRLSGAGGSTGNLAGAAAGGASGLPTSTGALAVSAASRRAVLGGTSARAGPQPPRVGRLRAGAGSPGADRVSGSGAAGHPKALTPSAIRAEAEAGLVAAAAGDDSGLVSADWAAAAANAAAAAGAALVGGGSSSGALGARVSGYSSSALAAVHLEPLGQLAVGASPRASGSGAAAGVMMRSPHPSDSGAGGVPQALSPVGAPDPLLAPGRLPRLSDGAAPSSPSPLPPLAGTHMATGDDAVGGLTGTAAARHLPPHRVSGTGQAGPGEAPDALSSPQASPTGHLGGAALAAAAYQQQWAMPRQPQPPPAQQRGAAQPAYAHHHPQSHHGHVAYQPPAGAATLASALPDPRNVTAPGAGGAAAAAAHKDPSWLLPPIAGSPSRSVTGPPGLGAQAAAVAALRAGAGAGNGSLATGLVGVSRTASDPYMQRPPGLVAQQQQQQHAQGQQLRASQAGAAASAMGGPASPGLASRANLGQGPMAAAGQRARRASMVGAGASGSMEGPLGALISLSSGVVGPPVHGGASPGRLPGGGRAARSSVGSPGMLPAPSASASSSQVQVHHQHLTVSVDSSSYPRVGSVSLMGVAGSGLLINGVAGGGGGAAGGRGAGGEASPPLISSQLKGGGGAAGGAGAARHQQLHAAGRR
ncbi:hypothetical protein HXX76_015578 [Chlamydomonas incerta]|uniref:Uncharacterized protein n=1 Tax=Chlamydomonas incerta TaxID=51695 RepID=A0A835SE57_CHLIN|nr:hypothetical protein HXX76_015578 [Chlamydomonas incerta]|eukprot:KAG2423062.1 hypothetical protein HXX76_015578 [Chlamydomonas incerta]